MKGTLLLLAALALAGCAAESPPPAAVEQSGVERHAVRGRYLGPAFDGDAMQVAHEEIPDVMEAMTMPFRLEDPSAIEGLEPGDPIAFVWVIEGLKSHATEIRVLPAETELALKSP